MLRPPIEQIIRSVTERLGLEDPEAITDAALASIPDTDRDYYLRSLIRGRVSSAVSAPRRTAEVRAIGTGRAAKVAPVGSNARREAIKRDAWRMYLMTRVNIAGRIKVVAEVTADELVTLATEARATADAHAKQAHRYEAIRALIHEQGVTCVGEVTAEAGLKVMEAAA